MPRVKVRVLSEGQQAKIDFSLSNAVKTPTFFTLLKGGTGSNLGVVSNWW
jgi:hypothetical protein